MAAVLQSWLAHHAPVTDGAALASFMRRLFAEDVLRERFQRAELLSSFRERARTLRPGEDPVGPAGRSR
jgi:hypothetical protein